MKIRRERPSQRLNHRVTAPLRVEMPDQVYEVADWSLGGLGVVGYTGPLNSGDEFSCTLCLAFQGFDIGFEVAAKVVRHADDGALGVVFADLGSREREIMSHFIDDLVRGAMAPVADAIMRIDSPVTPVPTTPDPNPASAVPVRRWSIKTFILSGMYLSAGVAVLGYGLLVFYSNFLRLEIDTAVVSAPIQPVVATTDGRVLEVSMTRGKLIVGQTPMILIEDSQLQQTLELAQINIDRETMELLARQKELEVEKEKMSDYRIVALAELERLNTRIVAHQKTTMTAQKNLQRVETLTAEGWATRARLDDARANHGRAAAALEEARLLRKERRALIDRIAEGRFFTGGRFDGRVKELKVAVDLAWQRVSLAKDELVSLERHRQRLVLSAPADGRLVKIERQVGSTVRKGDLVALFERDEPRSVEAFLTQEEVLEIGIGDEATAYFPSLRRRAPLFVSAIDRTEGFVDEIESQYEWRGPKDRSARVTLQFLDINQSVVRRYFPPGLPVVVIFERRQTSEIHQRIFKTLDRVPQLLRGSPSGRGI